MVKAPTVNLFLCLNSLADCYSAVYHPPRAIALSVALSLPSPCDHAPRCTRRRMSLMSTGTPISVSSATKPAKVGPNEVDDGFS